MGQMNFYVSANIEEIIRKEANKSNKAVSAYLAEIVKNHVSAKSGWPSGYFEKVIGAWEGEFPEIQDLPP
ncbi:MAG: hypothetical protein H7318_16420, partial [Oligoflexus sp.]|nr:hypothetical protein [Oligoflexus sp.]